MSFIWPGMLLSLLLLPLFIASYILLQQRRWRSLSRFGRLGPFQEATGRQAGTRRHIPAALFLLSLAVLMIALARPQTAVSLPRLSGTVILAIDVSGSMAAEDLKPNRMEAAKAAARDFVERQPASVDIGVVAFSGGGFAVQTPSNDREAILAAIERLKPELGTSLGEGILASLKALDLDVGEDPPAGDSLPPLASFTPAPRGSYPSAVIVLLSDGENNAPPDPLGVGQMAADLGVRIYTVGAGSPMGTTLNVNGFTVHTRLDEAMLQQIAQLTGGDYFNAETEGELHRIYENLSPQFSIQGEKMEVTSIFAGASILIMLIGGAFSFLWFNRLP